MLARSVRWTYFLCESGYAKYLSRAGNEEVSRFFFVLAWKQGTSKSIEHKLNLNENEKDWINGLISDGLVINCICAKNCRPRF